MLVALRRMARHLLIAACAAMVLIGCSGGRDGAAKSDFPLDLNAHTVGCPAACSVTGAVYIDHPTFGRVAIVTSLDVGRCRVPRIAAIDTGGKIRWHRALTCPFESLAPEDTAHDRTGHIFIKYNPGRYNGVIVLAPAGDGFDDFGSLPVADQPTGRFYNAEVNHIDREGIAEIVTHSNDCVPSCGQGTTTTDVYRWDGVDYAPPATPASSRRCPPIPLHVADHTTASLVTATGVDCATARGFIEEVSATHGHGGGSATFSEGDYTCNVYSSAIGTGAVDGYSCVSGSNVITWDRS